MSKTAQYLSKEEIREVATSIVGTIAEVELSTRRIPQPYPEELRRTRPPSNCGRQIEQYIARMQDEREPY